MTIKKMKQNTHLHIFGEFKKRWEEKLDSEAKSSI